MTPFLLETFPFRLNRNGAPLSCFDAFSSREPVSTSLENALAARLRLDKRGDEARHRRGEIARIMNEVDGGKFRLLLPGEIGFDPGAQRFAGNVDMQYPDHCDRSAGDDAIPMRAGSIIRRRQPGLLLDLAGDAARHIDRALPDVVEVGRTRREVDPPGIRGVLAHLTEYERAVGAAQRAHAKAVEHIFVGATPVAPRQEPGKIGFEIPGAETS